jgi:hypothetical protein
MKETPEQKAARIKRENLRSEQTFLTRPIVDARRWWKEHYEQKGMVWGGPEPDLWSPKDYAEEMPNLEKILYGSMVPRSEPERNYLRWFGGVQKRATDAEKKWIICRTCGSEFSSFGHPNQKGHPRLYPTICNFCYDVRSARPVPPPEQQQFNQSADA